MPRILFWNINKNNISQLASESCQENNVDIAVLAECTEPTVKIISELNKNLSAQVFTQLQSLGGDVKIFTRLPTSFFTPLFGNGRTFIYSFSPPIGLPLLFVFSHLPSKLYKDDPNQYYIVRELMIEIERCEKICGHSNTLIIGDLNINPFEPAMTAADGFHAIMDKSIALNISRTVQGKEWKFFFNPSWSLMGDESEGPPGSYYYNNGGDIFNNYWNNFDQCLIRPSLLPYYRKGSFKVISEIYGKSLIKNGRIDSSNSDHLPISMSLTTERITT